MRCTTVLRQQPPAGGCPPPPGPAPRGSGPPRATRRSPTTPRKVWRPTGTRGGPSPMGVRCFLWPGSQWVGGGLHNPDTSESVPPTGQAGVVCQCALRKGLFGSSSVSGHKPWRICLQRCLHIAARPRGHANESSACLSLSRAEKESGTIIADPILHHRPSRIHLPLGRQGHETETCSSPKRCRIH